MTSTNTSTSKRRTREPKVEASAAEKSAGASLPPADKQASTAKPAEPSKTDKVLALLKRPEGATLDQLVEATGWLPHTTRAALTGLRKKGHAIERRKADGVSRYAIVENVPA